MKQFVTSMAIAVTCSVGLAISSAMAAPFGSSPKQPASKEVVTPVSFIFDTNQLVLITAIDGLYYKIQDDGQGGAAFIDANGIPWTPVLCCTLGQVDSDQGPVTLVSGVFVEPTGHYGVPLAYDGGINALYQPESQ